MSKHWVRDYRYPKELIDLARRRVEGLMSALPLQTATLGKLLESAYIQGALDMASSTTELAEQRQEAESHE